MKRSIINRLIMMAVAIITASCSNDEIQAQTTTEENMTEKILITIDGQTLPITLVKNQATETLVAALEDSSITYEADDYGGFEKVGALGRSLPTSNQQITTQAGDVILYSGNQIVLFYGSNSWSYTRLGRIEYDSQEQLESFLKAGQGRVSVTLSLPHSTDNESTAIHSPQAASAEASAYVAANGMRMKNPGKGLYIHNHKKYIK